MKPITFASQILPRITPNNTFTNTHTHNYTHFNQPPKTHQGSLASQGSQGNPNDLSLNESQQTRTQAPDIQTSTQAQQAESEIIKQLETFMKQSENNYSTQKTDLMNLISETLTEKINEKHISLKNQIEEIITTKYNQAQGTRTGNPVQAIEVPPLGGQPGATWHNQAQGNQGSQDNRVGGVGLVEKKKATRGKYYKLTNNVWQNVLVQYPDLPASLGESAYIKDNEKFVKLKSGYVKIDESGVAKIMSLLK